MERPEAQKLSHAAVDYEPVSTHAGQRCGNCKHFIRANPNRCEGVKGPIAAGAYCMRYKRKEN